MSIEVKVEMQGLTNLIAHLPGAADATAEAMATEMEERAQADAPVRTGFLKSTIHKVRLAAANWSVVVDAVYAIYVEFGTRYMAAQPFMFPASQIDVNSYARVFLNLLGL